MAASRIIKTQHHRISQVMILNFGVVEKKMVSNNTLLLLLLLFLIELCFLLKCRLVKITIIGDEGVPVQVDGEAWVQPPGIIRIVHKNRSQMLCRNRVSGRASQLLMMTTTFSND